MVRAWWHRGSLWPWLALLLVSAAVVAGIAWEAWPRNVDLSLLRSRAPRPATPSAPTPQTVRVRLFFPYDARPQLAEEEREVVQWSVLEDGVRAVLQELTRVKGTGTQAPLPPAAEVEQVYLDSFGILYLDFGKGLEALASADAGRAALAVSAIALTLTTNFRDVKRVQFLLEGHEWAVQVGAADLRRPLQPQFPGEVSASSSSQPTARTE